MVHTALRGTLTMSIHSLSPGSLSPRHLAQDLAGLSAEADHRIANSLAFISNLVRLRAASAEAEEDPRTFLMEIADRIETVAQLHRQVGQSSNGTIRLS